MRVLHVQHQAKLLKQNQPDTEKLLWRGIRNRQSAHEFRRQPPIGPYIGDFICLELKLIIEVDGGQHAESENGEIRTEFLKGLGYKVVRFWNNEVLGNIDGVLSTLILNLSQRERK